MDRVTLNFGDHDKDRKASIISCVDGSLVGTLGEKDTIVFSSIAREPEMEIQPILQKNTNSSSASLSVIIYGPLEAFNEIGAYLTAQRRFLQQPQDCSRNVEYRNPHLLSGLDENVPLTLELCQKQVVEEKTLSVLPSKIDVLNGLESHQLIAEAETPKLLKTPLYRSVARAVPPPLLKRVRQAIKNRLSIIC